jgi:hypothetical protein
MTAEHPCWPDGYKTGWEHAQETVKYALDAINEGELEAGLSMLESFLNNKAKTY